MLFNSIEFIIFFAAVFIAYFLIPKKIRWLLLLPSSYFFYMYWNPAYALLLAGSTTIDFFAALKISHSNDRNIRKALLLTSLVFNLGILFIFKYYNFFLDSLHSLFPLAEKGLSANYSELLLPVGISFYTFQTMGYTIDVFNKKVKPERNFARFALYVSFFPQLVAGPIERAKHLLPQFRKEHTFDYDRIIDGLKLSGWGMFKKVVIADRLALCVDQVYNHPQDYSGLPLILATVFFAFQIYCDFSGYTDIARGIARILGYDIMRNFNRPYLAANPAEFWKRWHISLSTWFRDYVYIPLGGNRCSYKKWLINILITFMISGLWHGANSTFILWGLLHGTYYLVYVFLEKRNIWRSPERSTLKTFQIFITFALITFAWVFFRSNTLPDAFYITSNLFNFSATGSFLKQLKIPGQTESMLGLSKLELVFSFGLIGFLIVIEQLQHVFKFGQKIKHLPVLIRWALYYALCLAIPILGIFKNDAFIYFQF